MQGSQDSPANTAPLAERPTRAGAPSDVVLGPGVVIPPLKGQELVNRADGGGVRGLQTKRGPPGQRLHGVTDHPALSGHPRGSGDVSGMDETGERGIA